MSDVTVVGLGAMGSALARALVRGGHEVTVWNRTKSKAEPLVREGAALAPDLASGVAASPVVLVCLRDHEVARALLLAAGVRPHLSGRVVLQLGGGMPQQAREGEGWARDNGAEYLEGEIMVYPAAIGSADATILVAGAEATFRRCEPVLRSLAGNTTYLGDQVGAPNAYGVAMGSVLYGALLGALHGAQVCEVEGLSISFFANRLREADMATVVGAVEDLLERIEAERYGETQGPLQTGADGAEMQLQHALDTGIDLGFPSYVAGTFRSGMDAGLGDQDVAALIKVLRDEA